MEERKGSFRTVMIWGGVIVLLLIGLHAALVGGTNHRVKAELALIKAKGEPVTAADLNEPKIPEADNAAVLFEQAFKMMKTPHYEKDVKAVEELSSRDMYLRPAGDWANIAEPLRRTQPIVTIIRQAASRPKCQFAVDYRNPATLYPQFASLRSVTRLLSADAASNAVGGRMEAAVDSIDTSLSAARLAADDRSLIGLLVYVATVKICTNSLRSAGELGGFSELQAKRLYDTLGKINMRRSYVRAMQGERAIGVWGFEQMASGKGFGTPTPAAGVFSSYPLRPLLNADQGYYLSFMRRQVDAAGLTCLEMKKKHIDSEEKAPAYAIISNVSLPVFSRAGVARDSAMADVAIARTFLALQAYRDRYRAYPASLTELRKRLGWKIDADPFSGKDLVYKPGVKGFVLYSLGEDMKDNGGKEQPATTTSKKGFDIVWKSSK